MKFAFIHVMLIASLAACTTPESMQASIARTNNFLAYTPTEGERAVCRKGLSDNVAANIEITSFEAKPFTGFINNGPFPINSNSGYYVTTQAPTGERRFIFMCGIRYEQGEPRFALEESLTGLEGQLSSFQRLQTTSSSMANAPSVPQAVPTQSFQAPVAIDPAKAGGPGKIERVEPFRAALLAPEAHQECVTRIRDSLLDPTSFSLTSNFEPDPLWLGSDRDVDANDVVFSAKMLARNRGGNIAPFRAMCYYSVNGPNVTFKTGFSL